MPESLELFSFPDIPQTVSGFVLLFLMGTICFAWASALQHGASASVQVDVCFWHWVVGSLSE